MILALRSCAEGALEMVATYIKRTESRAGDQRGMSNGEQNASGEKEMTSVM